jgi:hypothetical protein
VRIGSHCAADYVSVLKGGFKRVGRLLIAREQPDARERPLAAIAASASITKIAANIVFDGLVGC